MIFLFIEIILFLFIQINKTYINIYKYTKNKSFQLETKILYNHLSRIITHPNSKNVGIFHMNQNNEIFVSELSNKYKIINTFKLKELESLDLYNLLYKRIKSNKKSYNKFIISDRYYIFLYSSPDFKLLKKIEGYEGSLPFFKHIFITKIGDIFSSDDKYIYKLNLEDNNIIKDKYGFDWLEERNDEIIFFNIFEKNENIIITRGIECDLYFYNVNIPKYYLRRYLTFLLVSLIFSSILMYLIFANISFKFLLTFHLVFLIDVFYEYTLEITYFIYFILFFIYFLYSSIISFGLLNVIGFIFILFVIFCIFLFFKIQENFKI